MSRLAEVRCWSASVMAFSFDEEDNRSLLPLNAPFGHVSNEHKLTTRCEDYCPRRVFGPRGPKTRGGTLGLPV